MTKAQGASGLLLSTHKGLEPESMSIYGNALALSFRVSGLGTAAPGRLCQCSMWNSCRERSNKQWQVRQLEARLTGSLFKLHKLSSR